MSARDIYAGDRVDYMNARRNAKPGAGGKSYARLVNPVDERARLAGLDPIERAREAAYAVFASSRAIVAEFRNQRRSGIALGEEIPF